jgi:hypothetical protein
MGDGLPLKRLGIGFPRARARKMPCHNKILSGWIKYMPLICNLMCSHPGIVIQLILFPADTQIRGCKRKLDCHAMPV